MPDSSKLYFSFSHDGNTINSSSSVGAGDLGAWYSKNQVLNSRFFIRVDCDDFQVNRVLWDIPVPDTLQHAPPKGWDKIPYDLEKYRKKPFTSFKKRYGRLFESNK
ncbi:MAG: hypothetical protein NXI00_08635 [Cytophagales bacterium]|nr:hypothetical protein [Cytophagales bacterium]